MSHGIWVQRTLWMAYNVQGYNNVPFGMDAWMVSRMPKNTLGVGHLQLWPQTLVHENDNIVGD